MQVVMVGLCLVGGLGSIAVALVTAMTGPVSRRPPESESHGSE
jgi:hypothetical protein